jgi:hypothetical protein
VPPARLLAKVQPVAVVTGDTVGEDSRLTPPPSTWLPALPPDSKAYSSSHGHASLSVGLNLRPRGTGGRAHEEGRLTDCLTWLALKVVAVRALLLQA